MSSPHSTEPPNATFAVTNLFQLESTAEMPGPGEHEPLDTWSDTDSEQGLESDTEDESFAYNSGDGSDVGEMADEHEGGGQPVAENEPPSESDSAAAAHDEGRVEEEVAQHQTDMRRQIMEIQGNDEFSAIEKAKRIQELMSKKYHASQSSGSQIRASVASNKLNARREDFSVLTEVDRQRSYHDKDALILGCKHYQRAVKLQAHCCGKWFTCRFCHDEVSDHSIVRSLTKTMMCMYCSTVQAASQNCTNAECAQRVAKYFCAECKLWDDDPRKHIYHCNDCGICRIGKGLGQDYFHCARCNVCMAIGLKGNHKCIERNLESDCPICGEYMFTSTTTVIFMPCGHCIHYKCHQEYIQTSYQCPTCFKSLANMTEYFKRIDIMLAQHTMPPEYAAMRSHVYCNDCETRNWAKFHFLYHKCRQCLGYNTKVLRTCREGEEDEGKGSEGDARVPPAPIDTQSLTVEVTPGEISGGLISGSSAINGHAQPDIFDISPPFIVAESMEDISSRRSSNAVEDDASVAAVGITGSPQGYGERT